MRHVLRHDLEPELAHRVADRAFEAYRDKYSAYRPQLTWITGTVAKVSFSAKGIALAGTIELLPGKIAFDLDVPFVLRLFQSKAIGIVERELSRWCDKAKRGELG